MQQLFPEGDYFLRALTAMAEAAHRQSPDLDAVRALRDSLDRPESVAVFGSGMVPEHGIFQAGWALAVAVDLARASGTPADADDVRRRAAVVEAALRGSRSGFLEGYPGQYWPCDTVVAASALADAARAARPARLAGHRPGLARPAYEPARRPDHRAAAAPGRRRRAGRSRVRAARRSRSSRRSGRPIGRALDGRVDPAAWEAFRRTFVVREAGLVGVREFPRGQRRCRRRRLRPAAARRLGQRQHRHPGRGPGVGDTELADGPGPGGRAARAAAALGW